MNKEKWKTFSIVILQLFWGMRKKTSIRGFPCQETKCAQDEKKMLPNMLMAGEQDVEINKQRRCFFEGTESPKWSTVTVTAFFSQSHGLNSLQSIS